MGAEEGLGGARAGVTVSVPREAAQKAHAELSSLLVLGQSQRTLGFVLVMCGGVGFAARRRVTLGVNSSAHL